MGKAELLRRIKSSNDGIKQRKIFQNGKAIDKKNSTIDMSNSNNKTTTITTPSKIHSTNCNVPSHSNNNSRNNNIKTAPIHNHIKIHSTKADPSSFISHSSDSDSSNDGENDDDDDYHENLPHICNTNHTTGNGSTNIVKTDNREFKIFGVPLLGMTTTTSRLSSGIISPKDLKALHVDSHNDENKSPQRAAGGTGTSGTAGSRNRSPFQQVSHGKSPTPSAASQQGGKIKKGGRNITRDLEDDNDHGYFYY